MRSLTIAARPSPARLIWFASGDFAFNLYWQSLTLLLFFYYTDVARFDPAVAGLVLLAGSLWDGVANLVVGGVVQRRPRRFAPILSLGALPLGLGFVLLYTAPATVAAALAAQVVFRTLYAALNIPYSAWSSRITDESGDRTLIAGARMLFGAAAAGVVALGAPALSDLFGQRGYVAAAILSALIATPWLIAVAVTTPEAVVTNAAPVGATMRRCLAVLARNRAFVTLNIAAALVAVASAVIGQSVLFYFRDVAGAPDAGPRALAAMALAGVVATLAWTAIGRRLGARATWFGAATLGLIALAMLAITPTANVIAAVATLAMLQAALAGFNLGFWSLLPDTVEYGELHGGLRVDTLAYGVALFIQRVAIGLGAAAMGLGYRLIGYLPGAAQDVTASAGVRWILVAVPALTIALSVLAMRANPLARGVHARIVAELARRATG